MNSKKLSILLVSPYVFAEDPSGVKDFILGLKTALIKRDCIVNVIAPGSKDAQEKGLVDFVLGMGFRIITDQTEFRASLSRKETAKKILDEVKPDVIVLHEPFLPSVGHSIISSIARNKKGRPILIIGQFHSRREDFTWFLKIAEFVVRHLIRKPKLDKKTIVGFSAGYVSTIDSNLDGRITVSEATKKFWQKNMPASYKIIYNGIDINKLAPIGPKIESWIKENKKIILFAGRHDKRKGIADLITAVNNLVFKGVNNICLKIAGSGEQTKFLRKITEKLKLQKYIQFLGILSREQLIEAYRTADLLVAPSIGGEGFNRTIIEARASGTLVVCTNIQGQNEAIGKDLAPFMAKAKNPNHLAEQIMLVLNLTSQEKEKIKEKSRAEAIKLYSWDKIAEGHLSYYIQLLSKFQA